MSGFSTPQGGAVQAAPKQISNRLLNMKFMQRASASNIHKTSSSPSTPTSEPPPKRRRTGDFAITVSNLNSPATPNTPAYGDRTAISGALSAEANGLSIRRGTNHFETPGEETEWVLNLRLPITNEDTNGNYEDDEESEDEDDIWSSNTPSGRQSYGSFDKKKRKQANSSTSASANTTSPSATKSSKKRGRADDEDDEDLSSIPSDLEQDSEEGEIEEHPRSKNGRFDFKSEADLKRMDSFDFQKAGAEHGFGRQRHGLGGGGGGGGFGSATSGPGSGQRKQKRNKNTR